MLTNYKCILISWACLFKVTHAVRAHSALCCNCTVYSVFIQVSEVVVQEDPGGKESSVHWYVSCPTLATNIWWDQDLTVCWACDITSSLIFHQNIQYYNSWIWVKLRKGIRKWLKPVDTLICRCSTWWYRRRNHHERLEGGVLQMAT